MTKFLITGVGSGLGRYLHERFSGVGLTRDNFAEIPQEYEVIIHCAFNSAQNYKTEDLERVILEDISLASNLVKRSHRLFIFISSIDVHRCQNAYAMTKKIVEYLIKKNAKSYLILRPSALLGKYSRSNSLIKMIQGDCSLTLSKDSVFNYVLHQDIGDFIQFAIQNKIEGIYDLAATESIVLGKVAAIVEEVKGWRNIQYGSYQYLCSDIDVSEIIKVGGFPLKTSEQVIREFLKL